MQTPPKLGGRSSSGGSNGEPRVLSHRTKTMSNASSVSSSSSGSSSVTDIKCPELLVRGDALQQKVPLEKLFKKGKRFESGWSAYFVAIYANTLFYYERLDELPRGVVPLAGSSVMAVDRIFKHSDSSSSSGAEPVAEECGPCWKVTSSAGRVLLFRSTSSDDRQVWIDRVNQANVEHPSHRRRSSSRRGSFEGTPGQGRRRRSSSSASASSRHSLDEAQLRYNAQHQQHYSDAASTPSVSHEVSEMLRDAMQLVKQQKQEILALKSKLRTLEAARDDAAAAAAVLAVEDAVALVLQDDNVAVATESLDTGDAALLEQAEAIGAELEDHGSSTADSSSDQAVEPTEAAPVPIDKAHESTSIDASDDDDDVSPVVVPPAPLSAPAQLEHVRTSDLSSSPLFRATSADASAVFSASAGPTFGSASYSAPGNDYLQQQAMELAEIARSLQSSFRTDYAFSAAESAPSAASTYIESFSQRNSTSDMLSTDMFSFDDDHPFEEGDDYERLSEFDESDESFLEASGILDSIHQVMKDFIVTSTPEKQPDQIIISDDVIAEIRQGIERKDAEEARRLRQLRSLSDFNDSSTSMETPDPSSLQRAKSARDFMVDFGVGGIAKMSRPRRDLGTLVVEDTMTVVSCVLQTVGREEKMVLLYPLLRLFGSHNRLSRLIRWAIEIEVASVINVATLFRSDDYASRLVSSYSKCVGLDFIRVVLAEPIREILTLKIADLELNPDKHASLRDESTVTTNAGNLMRACQNILDAILQNAHQIPSSYFHICSHLNSKVIRRFDGSCEGVSVEDPASLTRSVIGGFLFLRFVCPAITTPHLYNLTEKEPPPESRRVLVLLTKLLFKTATCVMFGDREPQFKILNPFIERNSPAIQQLFIDLSTSPERDIDECFAADSRNIFSNVDPTQLESDNTVIRSITEKHLDEIGKKLSACGFPPQTTSEFKVAVLAPSVGPRETPHHAFLDAQKLPKSSKKLSVNKFLSFGKKSRKPHTDV